MKYEMSWTTNNGQEVTGQIFTADNISNKLKELESWGATNIVIKSVDDIK